VQKRRQDVALCLLLLLGSLLALDHSLHAAAIVVIAAGAPTGCSSSRGSGHVVLPLCLHQVTAGAGTQLQAGSTLMALEMHVFGLLGAQVLAIELLLLLLRLRRDR